jgi:type IV secretory pathway VirJ component
LHAQPRRTRNKKWDLRFFAASRGTAFGKIVVLRYLCKLALPLALAQHAGAATIPVHFGLFGTIHTAMPTGDMKRTVVLISDQQGWDARAEQLASGLAADGALVFGVDLPAYLKQMESINDKCSFPAAHFEEMSDWMQRNQKVEKFTYPLLVGDGAGATLAYAVDAQAPKGTFEALITLGWDASLRLPKPLCKGDAGLATAPDGKGQFRVAPVARLPNPWLPQPLAPGARSNSIAVKLPATIKSILAAPRAGATDAGAALAADIAWLTKPVDTTPPLPQDVADLPLIEVPPLGTFADRVAIILTGDGGWAGLDVAVADQLARRGIQVVGFNTLKFFWQTRKPEEAADALTRIIGHYGAQHPQADFVVIGYSFGAALAPVAINRVPDAARTRIAAQVLISPDSEAVFEVHVGDWFGSTHHEGAIAIAPEITRTKVPVICVHDEEEGADSFCQQLIGKPNVRQLPLPGGHHYNGDYDKLGAGIAGALPAHK